MRIAWRDLSKGDESKDGGQDEVVGLLSEQS